ncbi:hypothetical protein HYW20_02885 [Candidatus Woesearchaeota archaeon]|nr:hypothetical protein [Candidatus Woesearchaeota archaeon]
MKNKDKKFEFASKMKNKKKMEETNEEEIASTKFIDSLLSIDFSIRGE